MRHQATALLAVTALAFAMTTQAADAKREDQALSNANVSLTQAIHMAEEQGSGKAISAEYEPKSGTAGYYQVKVLSNDGKKLTRYRLDPNTGKVTDTSDEPIEKAFTRLKPASISNAPTSLTRAITTAEQRAGGKATDASVDRDGDQVQYTVKVAKADGSTEKVKVNGSNGKVASAK